MNEGSQSSKIHLPTVWVMVWMIKLCHEESHVDFYTIFLSNLLAKLNNNTGNNRGCVVISISY
jgi:hypothetical protein